MTTYTIDVSVVYELPAESTFAVTGIFNAMPPLLLTTGEHCIVLQQEIGTIDPTDDDIDGVYWLRTYIGLSVTAPTFAQATQIVDALFVPDNFAKQSEGTAVEYCGILEFTKLIYED